MRKFMSSLPYLSVWLSFNNDLSLLHNLSTTNCDSMYEQNVFNYVRVSYWFEVSLLEGDGQNLFRWEAIHHVHHRAPCVPYSNGAIRGLHYVYQLLLMFMAFAFFSRIRFSGFGSRVQDCWAHKEVTINRLNRVSVIKQFICPLDCLARRKVSQEFTNEMSTDRVTFHAAVTETMMTKERRSQSFKMPHERMCNKNRL